MGTNKFDNKKTIWKNLNLQGVKVERSKQAYSAYYNRNQGWGKPNRVIVRARGFTHVGQSHFFTIINTRYIGFTLGHKIIFMDVFCEKQFIYLNQTTNPTQGRGEKKLKST